MKIEMASQTSPWIESPEMARLLEALGSPNAFVSNESTIGDFISGKPIFVGLKQLPWRDKLTRCYEPEPGSREAELAPIAAELKLDLSLRDYLIDVCALMHGQTNPN